MVDVKNHIALHMYEPMLLTKNVIGAPVQTRDGELVGRVYDVHVRGDKIVGIIMGPEAVHFHDVINIMKAYKTIPHIIKNVRGFSERGYVSWKNIRKIKNGAFILERRKRRKIKFSKPKGTSIIKRVLDEQITDANGKYIGRIDEVQFVYVYGERVLTVVGFYSGASAMLRRVGLSGVETMSKIFKIEFSENMLPWKLIKKISREPPTRVILKVSVN